MDLKYCSITGADDPVNPQDLADLSQSFPFVEWAILYMPSAEGTPRFPKSSWIKSFAGWSGIPNKAMHLCGEGLLSFIAGDDKTIDMMKGFQRIQLNLKFGEVEGKYAVEDLVNRVSNLPDWQFIIQYTDEKKELLNLFKNIPHHAVLFDESAGRGISPDAWSAPLTGHFCGYAGGLNPDNLEDHLEMIAVVSGGQKTWIDMETGVRTDNVFDLSKVRRVLETTKKYL